MIKKKILKAIKDLSQGLIKAKTTSKDTWLHTNFLTEVKKL